MEEYRSNAITSDQKTNLGTNDKKLFSQIAELLPQAAYLFYINEFKDKFGNFYEQCQMLNIICNQKKKL